jgi:hypothetical protein
MPHQRLNGLEVVPVVQESRGENMPHDVRMDPLLDQCFFYHGFNQTVNGLRGESVFLVRAMFPQCLKKGVSWIGSIPGGLQVVLYGDQGFTVQGDSSELIPLADDIDNGLVAVGLEITDLEAAYLGLS